MNHLKCTPFATRTLQTPALHSNAVASTSRVSCYLHRKACIARKYRQHNLICAGKGFGSSKSPKKQHNAVEKTVDEAEYARRQKRFQQDFKNSALAWDDTFASICKDSATAQHVWQKAEEGYSQRGRGCVFVRVEVHDRFKVGKKTSSKGGLTGAPLPTNPDLMITSLQVDYIPLSFLRNPVAPSSNSSVTAFGAVPSLDNLMASDGPANADKSSHVTGEVAEGTIIDINLDDEYVDPDVLEQLQRAMRGMDPSRTINLVAGESVDVGGERGYEPSKGEAVVLLATRVDGMPLIGADIVSKETLADGTIRLGFPEAVVG